MTGRWSRRAVLGTLVVVTWLGMLGWHVRREYFQPELTRLLEATTTLAPGTNFYALRMGEEVVGTATSRLDTIPDRGGFVLEDQMQLELRAMGQPGAAVTRTRVQLSSALAMQEFAFSLDSEAGSFEARGTVDGDSLLTVEVEAGGGGVEEVSFRLQEAPIFAAILPIRVAMSGQLEVGRSFRFPVFDPSTVSNRTVEVEVLEEGVLTVPDTAMVDPETGRWVASGELEVPAWRIGEDFGGVRVESWIDEDGRVLRSSSPMGFSMEKTRFELARQEHEESRGREVAGVQGDVILSTAIESDVDLGNVEAHDELRFVLSGVDLQGFELDGGRQELRGDTVVVRRESWDELAPGFDLPYPRMDLREALQSEPLIQSGDERILREAHRAVGGGSRARSDPLNVARRLNTHVFGSLEKEITLTIPSALQVLETRRGDCNEHTVLYIAMARALGLPARTAVGVVYLDGSFFYHAWPEVWLGQWVAVDPTFGQVPASAAHIRFSVGGLAQQVEIARLIGNLRIEVLEPAQVAEEE